MAGTRCGRSTTSTSTWRPETSRSLARRERMREDDAVVDARVDPHAHLGIDPRRRHRGDRAQGSRPRGLPAPNGRGGVPGVQPHPEPHRGGEHLHVDALRGGGAHSGQGAVRGTLDDGGARGPDAPSARQALGWPAAARRDRPGARARSAAHRGRRAHRVARLRAGRRRDPSAARARGAGARGGDRDARRTTVAVGRPGGRAHPASLERVASARPGRTRGGEVLFRQGAAGDLVYEVDSGRIDIIQEQSDGGENLLAVVEPGNYFGELAPMFGLRRVGDRTRRRPGRPS